MFDFNLQEEMIRLRRLPDHKAGELALLPSWKDSLKHALKNQQDFEEFFQIKISSKNQIDGYGQSFWLWKWRF